MSNKPDLVAVHPLVLLSVVDHYKRVVAKSKNKRVAGVLLGEWNKGQLDITNCYAVPFEEDPKEHRVWFLDHIYHENMYAMFKKISAKEKVVGWYITGTKFKPHDIDINELFKKYTPNPVLVMIDVEHADELGLPTEAYSSIEEVTREGTIVKSFVHVPSAVQAFEPEEIGVEQLLRDIKDVTVSTLTTEMNQKLNSLKGLVNKMNTIKKYLDDISEKKKKPNLQIIYNLQEIFNCLPNMNAEDMVKSLTMKNNDNTFVLYVCSIIRSMISIHNLINNKLQNKETERGIGDQKEKEKKEAKEKEAKEGKDKEGKEKEGEKEEEKPAEKK
jgi:26S proteasome regulatory subunit N8